MIAVAELKMKEIAACIEAHLKRFEADPAINLDKHPEGRGLYTYFHAGAYYSGGPKIMVQYVGYQGQTALSKADALRYLEWLDAGNVGRHFEALR